MKKFFTFVLVAVMSFSVASPAVFAEEAKPGNSVTGFFRRLFNYPVKATQETAETVGHTASNVGEKVIAATGENTAAIVTGDLSKTGELVADPIVGTAETAGQTVAETVQIPVKAAEETPAS